MRLSIAALGLALTACYTSGEGISPPLDRIYFPVGLTTECDARAGAPPGCQAKWLYVANSDFDLQYNAGSIQVLDLVRVRSILDKVYPPDASDVDKSKAFCGNAQLDEQTAAEQVLAPGPCRAVDLKNPQDTQDGEIEPLVIHSVGIGAFAADVILTTDLSRERKRLLLPVRGEASLHWIDIDNDTGKLDCGQDNPRLSTPTCNREHRVGTEEAESLRNVKMPSEPFGIATSDEGDAIAVTHQTGGGVSLFYQDPVYYDEDEESNAKDPKIGWAAGPRLESVSPLSASQAVAIAAVPESTYVREQRKAWLNALVSSESTTQAGPDPYPPGFLVAFADAPVIDLVRYYADEPSSPSRPFLQRAASSPLRANAVDTISRGIALDDSRRRACDERDCSIDAASEGCKRCASESVDIYVSNRSPASLLIGATIAGNLDSDARDTPRFDEAWSLLIGASRVYVGKVLVDGKLQTRLFVVCFDQRRIAIYDPKSNSIEDNITTGRGPHAMAFDYYAGDAEHPARALAYVGHFTDSYVGVVQLDQSKLRNYGKLVLSLSERVAPRASK